MNIQTLSYPLVLDKNTFPDSVAAIGFFDGVHKGHQAVIQEAKDIAKKTNKDSAVITFDPHPSVVLQNKKDVDYITPLQDKIRKIENLEVDHLYIIHFNKELSKLSPQAFIDHFIVSLHITHLVAGFDFTFGHKGKGNMQNIQNYTSDELLVSTVERLDYQSEKISSTRIRSALNDGNVVESERLLGRPYSMMGEVIHGDKRGRTIGYPTANLKVMDEYFKPKIGVYAVEMEFDGKLWYGMASLGYNPTFTDERDNIKIEVHIFDFNQDIYGKIIEIKWKKYIRDELKFANAEELIEELEEDESKVRQFFSI